MKSAFRLAVFLWGDAGSTEFFFGLFGDDMSRRLRSFFSSLLVLSGSVATAHANEYGPAPLFKTKESFSEAAAAFGFCKGQEHSLEVVRTLHPDLSASAALVESLFHSRSGGACGSLTRRLESSVEAVRPGGWPGLRLELEAQVRAKLSRVEEHLGDRAASVVFLDDIRRRSDGSLEPSIASTLIASSEEFRANPVASWPRWTRVWDSASASKSSQIGVRVRTPIAFVEGDPNATHMIRKWTLAIDADGTNVMLQISYFPFVEGESLSSAIEEFGRVGPAELGRQMGEALLDFRLVDSRRVTLLRRPGYLFESEGRIANLTFEAKNHSQQVMAISSNGVVTLGCVVTVPLKSGAYASELFDLYRPICLQYFNSLTSSELP